MNTPQRCAASWLSALCAGLLCLSVAAGPAPARAQGAPPPEARAAPPALQRYSAFVQPPKHRVVLNNLLGLRLNPQGVEDQMRLGYQYRLSDRRELLFRDTFFFVGVAPRLNPAFIKIGPSIEIQPLTIFNLRVTAEYMGFFSTFGFLQSFQSPVDNYSDPVLKEGQDARRNYKAGGAHVVIEPTLQLRLGPFALRNRFSAEYWYFNLRDGDRVFYEVTLDTALSRSGWVLSNDLDLLLLTRFGLSAGVRYALVQPLYGDGDFRATDDRGAARNGHHRVGPIVAYTFFDHGYTRFNRPTLLLIANWYVSHRFRTGAETSTILPGVTVNSQAMPYVVLAFTFQSDLLGGATPR